jgi:hypothetical protein
MPVNENEKQRWEYAKHLAQIADLMLLYENESVVWNKDRFPRIWSAEEVEATVRKAHASWRFLNEELARLHEKLEPERVERV